VQIPWERARDQQRRARRSEASLADKTGAKAQANSGRFWWAKRDVRWGGFLIERRQTDKGSYAVSKSEFQQITRDAIGTPPGQLPALSIDFGDLKLIVLREEDHAYFQSLLEGVDDDAGNRKTR
jgi:hypothetical protein